MLKIAILVTLASTITKVRAGDVGEVEQQDLVELVRSGGDRDAHGCITSAGETWCESSKKCIFPWVEKCVGAEQDLVELVRSGGDRDAHGCITSAGETWCESSKKCIFPWVENCTSQHASLRGSKSLIGYWTYADSSGCIQTSLNYPALYITMKGTGIDTGHASSTIKHGQATCADQGYTVKTNEFGDLPLFFRAIYFGVTAWVKPRAQ